LLHKFGLVLLLFSSCAWAQVSTSVSWRSVRQELPRASNSITNLQRFLRSRQPLAVIENGEALIASISRNSTDLGIAAFEPGDFGLEEMTDDEGVLREFHLPDLDTKFWLTQGLGGWRKLNLVIVRTRAAQHMHYGALTGAVKDFNRRLGQHGIVAKALLVTTPDTYLLQDGEHAAVVVPRITVPCELQLE
jgi:hypothetical protein